MLTPNWEVLLVQALLIASGQWDCMRLLCGLVIVLSPGPWQHWLPGVVSGREGLTNGCAYLWVSFYLSWILLSPFLHHGMLSWWMFRILESISVFLLSAVGNACEEHINLVECKVLAKTHRVL